MPKARSLAPAATGKGPGDVRVVCKGKNGKKSLKLAQRRSEGRRRRASACARASRITGRQEEGEEAAEAQRGLREEVQVRLDPGRDQRLRQQRPRRDHARPLHRARVAQAPVNDPKCNPSLLQEDQGGALTPSYEYQATCPNDQNLIYVQGRAVKGEPLPAPDPDRHGIPEQELGECVRCNLQIEGSGLKPEDVILDAGKDYSNAKQPGRTARRRHPGRGVPSRPTAPTTPATPSTSSCAPTAPTASSAATS